VKYESQRVAWWFFATCMLLFGLQIIYFVLSLYGWYEWLYGGANHSELRVTRTPARLWMYFLIIGLVSWAVLSTITSRLPNAALPYMDSALVTVSLIAQYMMTKKYVENWLLWIVVDVFYVGMFIYKKLNLTAFNYLVYLGLAVVGYIAWRRSLAERRRRSRAPRNVRRRRDRPGRRLRRPAR